MDAEQSLRLLELPANASPADVKQAYRQLSKVWHPDRFDDPELKRLAEQKQRLLNEAYRFLASTPRHRWTNLHPSMTDRERQSTNATGDAPRPKEAGRRPTWEKTRKLLFWVGVAAVFIVPNLEVTQLLPGNAVVLVDNATREYFSPALLAQDPRPLLVFGPLPDDKGDWRVAPLDSWMETDGVVDPSEAQLAYFDVKTHLYYYREPPGHRVLIAGRLDELAGRGFKPDPEHRKQGAFLDTHSLLVDVLMGSGFRQPRWTAEGDWNW